MAAPETIPEIKSLVMLEATLYAGLRLWLLNYRATGKGARRRREVAHSFISSLFDFKASLGDEAFEQQYPLVSQELGGLLKKV
jgi:hypothetical protein